MGSLVQGCEEKALLALDVMFEQPLVAIFLIQDMQQLLVPIISRWVEVF